MSSVGTKQTAIVEVEVELSGIKLVPAVLEVSEGDRVEWGGLHHGRESVHFTEANPCGPHSRLHGERPSCIISGGAGDYPYTLTLSEPATKFPQKGVGCTGCNEIELHNGVTANGIIHVK